MLNSQTLYDNLCSKCRGHMYINEDEDLQCFTCGKILVVTVRRHYDTTNSSLRNKKEESTRLDMDQAGKVARRRVWNESSSNNHSKMVRQTGLGGQSRGLTCGR